VSSAPFGRPVVAGLSGVASAAFRHRTHRPCRHRGDPLRATRSAYVERLRVAL